MTTFDLSTDVCASVHHINIVVSTAELKWIEKDNKEPVCRIQKWKLIVRIVIQLYYRLISLNYLSLESECFFSSVWDYPWSSRVTVAMETQPVCFLSPVCIHGVALLCKASGFTWSQENQFLLLRPTGSNLKKNKARPWHITRYRNAPRALAFEKFVIFRIEFSSVQKKALILLSVPRQRHTYLL